MALVKYGGGIIQMAGSIAGNTYARNRSGNYVRARTVPTNPNTARQQTIRNALALLTARWSQTLTVDQRTAWELYASNLLMTNRLGEAVHITGFNHYLRSNLILQQSGLTLVDAGPTIFELPAKDPTFAITASEAAQEISVTFDDTMDWSLETGAYLVKFQGQPQNPQRNFFAGPWRLMGNVAGVDSTGASSPDVEAAVFVITELQHLWVYARIIRADGRLSEPFRADCFCAA